MEFNLSPPVESSKFFECVIAQKYCPISAMDMYSINLIRYCQTKREAEETELLN